MYLHLRRNDFATYLVFAFELISGVLAAAIPHPNFVTDQQQRRTIISSLGHNSSTRFVARGAVSSSNAAVKIISTIQFPNAHPPPGLDPTSSDDIQTEFNMAAIILSKAAMQALGIKHNEPGVEKKHRCSGYISKPQMKNGQYEFEVQLLKTDGSWIPCTASVRYDIELREHKKVISGSVIDTAKKKRVVTIHKGVVVEKKPIKSEIYSGDERGSDNEQGGDRRKVHWATPLEQRLD